MPPKKKTNDFTVPPASLEAVFHLLSGLEMPGLQVALREAMAK